ncbi:phage minor capsid protein [Melissococcus plutonius]|uniref:phage minor capsid protein n=1 Tax=Melissococcus plutonius TaxID=33970 RepID=UPI0021E567C6|nr:phage minor capsid protein [Melissococcus plutonius]MCV2505659.1 phage minor capsid protein [Melissococcus plutonius]
MLTPKDMQNQADKISDIYSALEDSIFKRIIQVLSNSRYSEVTQNNVLLWQAEQLKKMGMLNHQVIELLANETKKSQKEIEQLIQKNGYTIVNQIDRQLEKIMHKEVPVTKEIENMLDSLVNQTFLDLNNNVNQTLITTNYGENRVSRVFQEIIKKSTLEVISGLKTHEKAIRDNVYKWVDNGINSSFIDRAGHEWSMETYTRMVINTTSHRTYNDLRLKRMKDFDCVTARMSSHACARKACAYIQGQVVNVVPMSDDRANAYYDSIYNHGYGEPNGTQGINCKHILYPFVPDVNTNNELKIDPEEAIKNGEIQQKQRKFEQDIRHQKKRLLVAQELDDETMQSKCQAVILAKQKALRELISSHEFLNRDYNREQIQSS